MCHMRAQINLRPPKLWPLVPSWLGLGSNNIWKNSWKKYTSGPRYWNVPVLENTGTFLVHQYCLKKWYLRSLERAGCIQKQTILGCKNGLVLFNTRVPVSGTWSILFPNSLIHWWSQVPLCTSLKGVLHIYQKLACFVLYLKIINTFL